MSRQPLHLEPKRWSVVLTADRWTDMATSASGTDRRCLFVVIAVIVVIAAVAVTQIGPEAKGLALDEIAPPTA
jgi:hypothetical protein